MDLFLKYTWLDIISLQKLQYILFPIVKIKLLGLRNLWSILKDFINILTSCLHPIKSLTEKFV